MNNLTIIIKTVVLTALLHMVAPHATAWGLSPVMVGPERNSHIVLNEDCLNTDDDDDDDDDEWMDMTIRFDGKQMRAYADYIDVENNVTFHAYNVSTFSAKY